MAKFFGNGIKLSSGFDLNAQSPLDNRTVATTLEELEAMPEVQRYNGLMVFVESESAYYGLIAGTWVKVMGGSGSVDPGIIEELNGKIKKLENGKVDKVDGKGLSTNDFTDELKTKLENMVVPTKVSDLINDTGFITENDIPSDTALSPNQPDSEHVNLWFEDVNGGALLKVKQNYEK